MRHLRHSAAPLDSGMRTSMLLLLSSGLLVAVSLCVAARPIDVAVVSEGATANATTSSEEHRRELQGAPYAYVPGSTSQFWGVAGELFDPTSRVADYGWAGAWMSERGLPAGGDTTYDLVRDFGANGADGTSDVVALRAAIAAMQDGDSLFIPAGTFIIDQVIYIAKRISIQGAGRDRTTFYLPRCLNELYPEAWKAGQSSPWADASYFFNFEGGYSMDRNTYLGDVLGEVQRGATTVMVRLKKGGRPFEVGQMVRFTADDRDGALVNYLYAGENQDRSDKSLIGGTRLLHFATPLVGVTPGVDGTYILELMRPLEYDLRPVEWNKVEVHQFTDKYVFEAGISDVTLEFAPSLYNGHRKELGYNALGFVGCVHCWATRLRIINHDFGISLGSSYFVTVDDIIMTNTLDRTGGNKRTRSGHHQIRMSRSTDCLAQNIQLSNTYYHDVSLDKMAALNVYHSISGPNLVLDFHGSAVNLNLHSRINCGTCGLTFHGGGAADTGGFAGKLNTLWGLVGANPGVGSSPPTSGFAAMYTAVAPAFTSMPSQDAGFMLEPLDPSALQPWDLRSAMFDRRMGMGKRFYS